MLKRNTLVKHGREKKDADSERTPRGAMSEDLNAAPFQELATLSERSVAYSVGASNPTYPDADVLVHIRRAEPRDMRSVFELSNDPVVRANSIHSEPIAWETHVAWFNRAITDPDVAFFVAETETGGFVGQIRFNRRGGDWVVSISIDSAYRGRGLTKALLLEAMSHIPQAAFVAEIAASNTASLRLFASVGFTEDQLATSLPGFKTFKMTANA